MKAAAKAAGIDIWIAQPIGGYRSWAVQVDMKVNPGKYGLSTVSTVTSRPRATPRTGSATLSTSVRSGPSTGRLGAKRSDWLIRHAPEFGFFREFGDKDPNHFHHDGFTAVEPLTTGVTGAGGSITPIQKDEDMPITDDDTQKITQAIRNAVWLLGPNGEALRVEQALKDIANRQATEINQHGGIAARAQDIQENLLPGLGRNVAELKVPQVDANAVAKALAADPAFITAIAKAVNDDASKRLSQ
jgi:hypothetical protein